MPRSVLLRLTDIRAAITGIDDLIEGISYDTFSQNWGMQRAVERALEIISEATRHIPNDYKTLAPEIPWRQIAAIGNLLRHEYQRADSTEHLPGLAQAVDCLIEIANTREAK